MSIKFGRIDYSDSNFGETTYRKNQHLDSGSEGISLVPLRRDDIQVTGTPDSPLSTSGSHWASINSMFYLSGSSTSSTDDRYVSNISAGDVDKFKDIYHSFNQYSDLRPFHKSKFYSSASAIYIPQAYYGQRISSGSFKLTFRSGSATNTKDEIIIIDDGNGNLYAPSASLSQSKASSLSSSANYIGNIFYDLGIATLTETASYTGSTAHSLDYTHLGGIGPHTGSTGANSGSHYKFWDVKFNSTTPIFTTQYSITIPASQFNTSLNPTTRLIISESNSGLPVGQEVGDYANLRNELTGSDSTGTRIWNPYFSQIQLYRSQNEEPVLIANVPRPIKKRRDVDLIITFRIDH